jgi:hypothetical protein
MAEATGKDALAVAPANGAKPTAIFGRPDVERMVRQMGEATAVLRKSNWPRSNHSTAAGPTAHVSDCRAKRVL